LICLRLCLSACHAADQQQQRPDDDYLAISQAPLRRTLPGLLKVHPRFAEARFRRACGLPPCASTEVVVRWLQEQASPRPLLYPERRPYPHLVLDLSIDSILVSGDERENATPRLRAR